MTTEPKLAEVGVRLNAGCTCVPVTAATALVPSLLVTVTLPLVAPLVVGAKVTVSATLCAAASVTGTASPPTEIPAPLAATCVTVTLEFPVLASCRLCVELLPAFTLPKFKLAGESDMVLAAAVPVPLSATVAGEFGALLTMESNPLAVPAASGAYCTFRLAL